MRNGQIPLLLAALQDLIMGSTLVKCAATDVGIQWAGWALASALRTEKFYDLAGKSVSNFSRLENRLTAMCLFVIQLNSFA